MEMIWQRLGLIIQPAYFWTIIILISLLGLLRRHIKGHNYKIPPLNLKGKYAVVTGGNAGIGFQTAKQLALLGCDVIIGARNRDSAQNCIKLIKKINPNALVEFIPLDLSDRSSIQSFVSSILAEKIDFLINNAGVMGIPERKLTSGGVEMQWGVNHLGHFYLTYLLWPRIIKSDFYRIVNVSSRGHRWYLGFFKAITLDFQNINFGHDYDPHLAYSRSKLYIVLFTRALAAKIDDKKGLVVSTNPGVVRTNIIRQMTGDGIMGILISFALRLIWPIWCFFTKSAEDGALTTLFAIFSVSVKNGCYYSECEQSVENECVEQSNWNRLWSISEGVLKIKFMRD